MYTLQKYHIRLSVQGSWKACSGEDLAPRPEEPHKQQACVTEA